MNCIDVRKYWCRKYEEKFGRVYKSDKVPVELSFLKKAITNFNDYLVLEAIDRFFEKTNLESPSLLTFSNPKYFVSNVNNLLSIRNVLKYKRHVNEYPKEIQQKVKSLLKDYQFFSHELASDLHYIRRKEIETELQEITKELFDNQEEQFNAIKS